MTTAQLQILVVWTHNPSWLPIEPDWPLWEPTTSLLVEITEEESNTEPEFDASKRPTQVDSTDEQATVKQHHGTYQTQYPRQAFKCHHLHT